MKRTDFARGLTGAILAGSAVPAAAQAPGLALLRVGVNANDDLTPILWAQVSGIFMRAGLKVDIQKFSSGSVATAGLIGGALDITRTSLLPLINARSHGIMLDIVAPAEMSLAGDPTEGIVALKESSVTSGKDLNGATMPIPALHDFDEVATRAWIDATGGDSKAVKFIELPSSAVLAALQQGRVAAAFLSNPFLTSAVQSGKVKVIGAPNGAIAKRFLITCYCSTDSFVKNNRMAVRRFADALQRSVAYTNSHHADAVVAVAPFWGIDASLLANMKTTITTSSLDPRDIQPLIDAALRYGVISKSMSAKSMIAQGLD